MRTYSKAVQILPSHTSQTFSTIGSYSSLSSSTCSSTALLLIQQVIRHIHEQLVQDRAAEKECRLEAIQDIGVQKLPVLRPTVWNEWVVFWGSDEEIRRLLEYSATESRSPRRKHTISGSFPIQMPERKRSNSGAGEERPVKRVKQRATLDADLRKYRRMQVEYCKGKIVEIIMSVVDAGAEETGLKPRVQYEGLHPSLLANLDAAGCTTAPALQRTKMNQMDEAERLQPFHHEEDYLAWMAELEQKFEKSNITGSEVVLTAMALQTTEAEAVRKTRESEAVVEDKGWDFGEKWLGER
ncbi:unnamed protein product [Diplocarpon coronariae]